MSTPRTRTLLSPTLPTIEEEPDGTIAAPASSSAAASSAVSGQKTQQSLMPLDKKAVPAAVGSASIEGDSSVIAHAEDAKEWFDAVKINNIYTVQRLIGKHIDIDLRDESRITALMYAAAYGHDELVALLLEKGAKTDLTDKFNMTALSHAKMQGNESTISLLEKVSPGKKPGM